MRIRIRRDYVKGKIYCVRGDGSDCFFLLFKFFVKCCIDFMVYFERILVFFFYVRGERVVFG